MFTMTRRHEPDLDIQATKTTSQYNIPRSGSPGPARKGNHGTTLKSDPPLALKTGTSWGRADHRF